VGPAVTIGIDLGQRQDPTAIVVCEAEERQIEPAAWALPRGQGELAPNQIQRVPAKVETHYTAREMGRLPLGTPYPEVYRHVAHIIDLLRARKVWRPWLFIDGTGAIAAVDELRAMLKGTSCKLTICTFTYGDKYVPGAGTASVGKAFLVSRLQVLLQSNRLALPAKKPEAAAMARELQDYEIRVDQDANDKYGAFKVGTHDDLVTALGLAVLDDPIKEARSRTLVHY